MWSKWVWKEEEKMPRAEHFHKKRKGRNEDSVHIMYKNGRVWGDTENVEISLYRTLLKNKFIQY